MPSQIENELVGKIVSRQPALAKVFENHQIDYCCKGNARLVDACRDRQIDLGQVLREIGEATQSKVGGVTTDWESEPLVDLIDHILETHHAFLRTELPRVAGLIHKVQSAHGARHPELAELESVFLAMLSELESHMRKEERVLFPVIRTLEEIPETYRLPLGSVDNPIRVMLHEHDEVGIALRRIRALTNDFLPPKDACPTFRVMMESLSQLESDLHLHIHLENNILFPRAQQLERIEKVS